MSQISAKATCEVQVADDCWGEFEILRGWRVKDYLSKKVAPDLVRKASGMAACPACMDLLARASGAAVERWDLAFRGHKCLGFNGQACGQPTLFLLCDTCHKEEAAAEAEDALVRLEARFNFNRRPKACQAANPNGEAARKTNAASVARLAEVSAANGEPKPGHEAR